MTEMVAKEESRSCSRYFTLCDGERDWGWERTFDCRCTLLGSESLFAISVGAVGGLVAFCEPVHIQRVL